MTIIYQSKNSDFSEEEKIVQDGLNQFAKDAINAKRGKAGVFAYQDNDLVGGITATTTDSCLNIKLLWVDQNHRGKDIGGSLMKQLEQQAIDAGCDRAFVDTLSYQAPDFYTKLGYTEVARITGFYEGQDRVFYRKELKS